MFLEKERSWVLYEDEIERKHMNCNCCGNLIYYGDFKYEQDPCYQIEEKVVCEDCISDYVKDNFFLKLEDG